MDTQLWIAILTFLTAVVVAARWLIVFYFAQARELSQAKKSAQQQYILRIEGAIGDHRRILEAHQRELVEVSDRLLKIQASLAKNTEANANNSRLLNDYIETTAARFKKLESDYIQLKDGLILVRSKTGRGDGSTN